MSVNERDTAIDCRSRGPLSSLRHTFCHSRAVNGPFIAHRRQEPTRSYEGRAACPPFLQAIQRQINARTLTRSIHTTRNNDWGHHFLEKFLASCRCFSAGISRRRVTGEILNRLHSLSHTTIVSLSDVSTWFRARQRFPHWLCANSKRP